MARLWHVSVSIFIIFSLRSVIMLPKQVICAFRNLILTLKLLSLSAILITINYKLIKNLKYFQHLGYNRSMSLVDRFEFFAKHRLLCSLNGNLTLHILNWLELYQAYLSSFRGLQGLIVQTVHQKR